MNTKNQESTLYPEFKKSVANIMRQTGHLILTVLRSFHEILVFIHDMLSYQYGSWLFNYRIESFKCGMRIRRHILVLDIRALIFCCKLFNCWLDDVKGIVYSKIMNRFYSFKNLF